MGSKSKDVKQRPITDDFITGLSRDVEVRVNRGDSLEKALRETLEFRAPIELYEEGSRSSGSSTLGWLFTLGLLGAAAYGANLAAKEFLGQSLTDLAQDQTGAGSNGGYDYQSADYQTAERYSANSVPPAAGAAAGTASAAGAGATSVSRFEDHDDDFRTHHRTTYADTGRDYEAYRPAYEHGYRYATEAAHQDRSYTDLESEMRRSYEEEHGEGSYTDVEGATRHSFERTRRSSSGTSGVKSPSGASDTASGDPGSVTPDRDDDNE